jgi:hypothetical protein
VDACRRPERGSKKARSRRLILKERFDEIDAELVEIRKMRNSYINSVGPQNTNP